MMHRQRDYAAYVREQLEIALTRLAIEARDGNGVAVRLYSGENSATDLRKKTLEHLQCHRGGDNTVFLGKNGEEAFWANAILLINALQAALVVEGSELNQEVPL